MTEVIKPPTFQNIKSYEELTLDLVFFDTKPEANTVFPNKILKRPRGISVPGRRGLVSRRR